MTFRISSSQNRAGAIFWKGTKGSRTPEIMTFCGVGLLPPRLLAPTKMGLEWQARGTTR